MNKHNKKLSSEEERRRRDGSWLRFNEARRIHFLKRNLFQHKYPVSPEMKDDLIAENLHKRFLSYEVILSNRKWIADVLGEERFDRILDNVKKIPQKADSKSDNEKKKDTLSIRTHKSSNSTSKKSKRSRRSLTVLNVENINGEEFFSIMYSPNPSTSKVCHIPVPCKAIRDYKKIVCIVSRNGLKIDYSWLYSRLFNVNETYEFVVQDIKTICANFYETTVTDAYGFTHIFYLTNKFKEKKKIQVTLLKIIRGPIPEYCLVAKVNSNPEKEKAPAENKSSKQFNGRIPYGLEAKIEGRSYHLCGKEFKCNCCGGTFGPRRGYRFDFTDIYLCIKCKRALLPPSGRPWSGRVIYTPMGNKR